MVSLRKRYSPGREEPPVSTAPSGHPRQSASAETDVAKLAETDAPKPAETLTESSPAEQAAQNAIRQRLAEVERASTIEREEHPQLATEPQQPQGVLPEATMDWLRRHPEYLQDAEKNAAYNTFIG